MLLLWGAWKFREELSVLPERQRGVDGVEPKKISKSKNTSDIAAREEELLFISEQNEVNLTGE